MNQIKPEDITFEKKRERLNTTNCPNCGKELKGGSHIYHLKKCLTKHKFPEEDNDEEPHLNVFLTDDNTFIGFYTQ